MPQQIPIFQLSKHERIWLKEIFERSIDGQLYDVKDIWSKVNKKLPKYFRPETIDSRLITSNAENIRIHGVIALQKSRAVLKKIDKVVYAISENIFGNPKAEHIDIAHIASNINFSSEEVTFYLRLANEYITLFSGASLENSSTCFKTIRVDGGLNIFYNYREYPGIEKVVLTKAEEKLNYPEFFNYEERLILNDKIDKIPQTLELLMIGQEVLLNEIKKEMNEMKEMYSLPKKTWRQVFFGKLAEMVFGDIISETISKKIIEVFIPQMGKFFLG